MKRPDRHPLLISSALVLSLVLPIAYAVGTMPQLPNPGNTGVTKEQQEQLGLQAMAEVYKQMPVLPDSSPETQYIQQLGRKLVPVIPPDVSWPYQFHVIPQKEINAFALPGGPIFVNVGTITAAQSEAELAGVMSHEMSHIYMQHSIKQAKKSQLTQGLFGIVGSVLGAGGGAIGALGQMGLNIGGGLLSLKYSRGDEAQADSVGAIIMYKAGYNPVSLATFFERLEQQGGAAGPNFLSDHPNPGNRVAAVEAEIRNWPPTSQQAATGAFDQARQHAGTVRVYSAQEIAAGAKDGSWSRQNRLTGATPPNLPSTSENRTPDAAGTGALQNVSYSQVRPAGSFTSTQTGTLSISYPTNWNAAPGQNNSSLTIAPAAGVSAGAVAYGVVINSAAGANGNLDASTNALVSGLQQSNPGLRVSSNPGPIQFSGVQGRSLEMTGNSPLTQNGQPQVERDWLVTALRPTGDLVYLVFIAPDSSFSQLRPTYQRMLDSVRLR